MPEWVQTILNMLAQFTGGRGGIDHVIVNYAIAGFFWGTLFVLASHMAKSYLQRIYGALAIVQSSISIPRYLSGLIKLSRKQYKLILNIVMVAFPSLCLRYLYLITS